MSKTYVVLMDSDTPGKDARVKYEEFFGEKEAKNFHLLGIPDNDDGIVLEKLLHSSDKHRIKEITGKANLKKAFSELFYREKNEIEDVMTNLHLESKSNFDYNIEKIL